MDKRRNPRQLQYQIKTEAPSAFIKTVPLFQWRSSLSEPVRIKRGLATHLQSFIVSEPFGPPKESIPKVYRWFAPLSEPVRRARTPNKVNLFPFTAVTTSQVSIGWLNPLSEPTRKVRAAQKLYPLSFTAQATSQTTVVIDWFTPLSEPIRVRTSPANQQVLAFAPNPIVATGWSVPLSEPARVKLRAIADYAYAPLAVSEVVTVDKWFNPLAPPLRAKPGLLPSSQQAIALVQAAPFPETVTESRWHQPWSEPVRRVGLSSANQQALAFVALVAVAAAPAESWFAPLTDPVRRIPAAQKVNLFPFTGVAVIQPTVDIGWFTPLSDPVRKVPAAQKLYPLSFTAAAVVTVETVTVDKWFVSFTDPVRVKPQLATGSQQSLAFVKATPFSETVTESRWHQPWSEPLRSKPGLSAANQAAFFATTTVETVTADKWFVALSQPPKPKTSVAVASIPALTISTNPVVSFGWAEPLSDPTRRKPEDRDRYSGENDWTAIAVSMEWFAPLNEPVRQKIGLSVTQQRALAFVVTIASTEVVTVDKWFVSFQDPVRVKPALLTGRQQFLTWPTQIIIPSLTSWWRPLAEPPKAKAGLLTANQRFATQAADFIPHPNQFLEGWFNWFSEPVRKLAQLNTALQRAWFGPDRNAVQATVTATMAVTEVNGDVALFAIKVLPYNAPATAVVSLVEIGHGASLTSIVEEGDDGSGTSIVEN